jgi:protein involved in polysaccharide export with SLBB domain
MSTLLRLSFSGIAMLLLLSGVAQAQIASPFEGLSFEEQEARLGQQARREATQRILASSGIPLEGALDPNTYVVGPGDVFSISIGGALPVQLAPVVTADGALVIPEVGSLPAAGRTLADVLEQVRARLQRSYRNVATDVALAQPRQFYVHVAGAVPQPGRHVVAPVARVEDAVAASMNGASPLSVLRELRRNAQFTGEQTYLPALRSIEIRRRDGSTQVIDLWRYYTSGDLRFNPYVRDGDAVYVPTFRDDLSAVTVEGEVPNPGSYDFRDGDTALNVLGIATGAIDFEELGPVRLLSRSSEPRMLDAAAIAAGRDENPPLKPGDRLLVLPRDLTTGVATVAGYVHFPGSYPIRTGETTLQDLVELAGGFRPEALVRGAYLERRGIRASVLYEPDQPVPFRDIPLTADINPQAVTNAIAQEVAELTRNSDLTFAGRQYYGRELLQPQRISVDIEAVLAGDAPPVPLQDGDALVVPRDPGAVLVVGQVQQPGYVPYAPGADAEYYVTRAGGRGQVAAETYVRKAGTGTIRPAEGLALASGDYVFVDRVGVGDTPEVQSLVLQERNLALQQEQARALRRQQYIQTGLAVVGTVATFLTTYIALTRNN